MRFGPPAAWSGALWEGKAAERIVQILLKRVPKQERVGNVPTPFELGRALAKRANVLRPGMIVPVRDYVGVVLA